MIINFPVKYVYNENNGESAIRDFDDNKIIETSWVPKDVGQMLADGLNENQKAFDKRMRYLGVLGLLTQCSVYVPEEIRELIEQAFEDACADGSLTWRRVLDRIEIEPNTKPKKKGG